MDGTSKTTLTAKHGALRVHGDWLYCTSGGGALARIRQDGCGEEALLTDVHAYELSDDALRFIRLDRDSNTLTLHLRDYTTGAEQQLAKVDRVLWAGFNQGHLYYQLAKTDGRIDPGLFRVNIDGTEVLKVNKVTAWALESVLGDWMYFLQYDGSRMRVKLDLARGFTC